VLECSGIGGLVAAAWQAVSMAVAAERIMEARIARIESDVGHMREDVADLKQDVRALRGKVDEMDQRLCGKADVGDQRLSDRIDALEQRLGGKLDALQNAFQSAKIWALLLYIALAGAILGTMARGFNWI
jgi:hypothetical protein